MFLDNRLLEANMQAKPCATPTFYSEKISVWNPNRWCHKRDHQFRCIRATSRSSLETAHEPKDLERFGQWQTWRPKQTQSQHETNKITLSSIRLVTSPNYQATLQVYKDDHQEQFRHHHFCEDYWNSCGLHYHLYHPVPHSCPQELAFQRLCMQGLAFPQTGLNPWCATLGVDAWGGHADHFLVDICWHPDMREVTHKYVYGIYIYNIIYNLFMYLFVHSFIHLFLYWLFIYILFIYLFDLFI